MKTKIFIAFFLSGVFIFFLFNPLFAEESPGEKLENKIGILEKKILSERGEITSLGTTLNNLKAENAR
ncbi:MAG: hypothetical protein KAS99_06640, partial [Candidatus Omnitrophica bacterium]|nr:hypothetical protein [Candidatus Omnitrophota bacterium]